MVKIRASRLSITGWWASKCMGRSVNPLGQEGRARPLQPDTLNPVNPLTFLVLQQPAPTSPALRPGAVRTLWGWTGLSVGLITVILVCTIALLSRHRRRVLAGLRSGRRPKKPSRRLDAWAEAGRRIRVEPGSETGDETGDETGGADEP